MRRVRIGIPVRDNPELLPATLSSLRACTPASVEVVLLPDGAGAEARRVLAALGEVLQLGTADRRGGAACFNRLAASTDADVVVLLEGGAVVGPGWLEHLLAALTADPRHGLAGPSTNRAWNDQCVFPDAGGTVDEVAGTAALAAQRFGATTRLLEPLHSLADFCYVVRREVVGAIGAADEGYGLGPCWELDYNVRAARAGFRGIWACAAYVYRAPMTEAARREEAYRFEASKRRYQDKFCALRLRSERTDYEAHCRGEACEHFAPAALIRLRLPPPVAVSAGAPAPAVPGPRPLPLVSCIMPTRDRGGFVLQSIRYFLRQDYPACELIIIDDGADDLLGRLPSDARIRYVRLAGRQSIGAKRNHACELARGRFIAQWDDDDWYGPTRLSAQLAPLLSGDADITGLVTSVFFDLPKWEFWACEPELHRRLFVGDVHGGTLVYERWVWEKLARYPDSSLAEDATFLGQATRRGARLAQLRGEGLFIYLRHAANSWSFSCGQHVDPRGWRRISEPPLAPSDRAFYAELSPSAPAASVEATNSHPLVTCIMPTADRRAFVPQAIRYFLRQDYQNRELVVVDDGADPVADLMPSDPRIRYMRLIGKHTIGAKRNEACQAARGQIIVHWDDDDWNASWRVSHQVESLLAAPADLCGVDTLLFCDPGRGQAWRYVYPGGSKPWLAGGTLCYTKAFWRANPFPEISLGEDTRFVWAPAVKKILTLGERLFYVAFIHPGNSSPKRPGALPWHPYSLEEIQKLLGADWAFYTALLGNSVSEMPLVTCIMPTYDRRRFVLQAIKYFFHQGYPRRELIVVDDGDDAVADLIPDDPRVRYIRLKERASLGTKRNIAVAQARGEVIAHWDDDDWYHPTYLQEVVGKLLQGGDRQGVAGLSAYLVYLARDAALKVCRSGGVAGATLCYFRTLWEDCRYRDVAAAEDYFFLADSSARVLGIDKPELFMVIRHARHTWMRERGADVNQRLRLLPDYPRRIDELTDKDDERFYASVRDECRASPEASNAPTG